MATATIDERFRITLPPEVRAGLKPGDVLFVVQEQREGGPVLLAAKAINPLDVVDLEGVLRAAGIDPDQLPARLSDEQQARLTALLEHGAADASDAG